MGGLEKRGKKKKDDPSSSSSSLLLFTTMCMVGLPVEVQVKDGSLYSGVFHTASLHNGYGVILKKARKIGKGRHAGFFTRGSLVDTLVVFSDDLVQIAVKDISLPVERIIGNFDGDGTEAATRKIESHTCILDSERDLKPQAFGNNSPLGQVEKDMPEGEENSCKHIDEAPEANKIVQESHCPNSNDVCTVQVNSADDSHGAINSPAARSDKLEYHLDMCSTSTSFPSSDSQTSIISGSSTLLSNIRTSLCPSLPESPTMPIYKKSSSCVTNAKEFKLNPGAKVFSPSPANSRSAGAALPTITSPCFISNIPFVLPIATAEPGVEVSSFPSRASVPTKLVQYNGFVNGHTGVAAQYSRHVVGYGGAQQQPVRFCGPYQSLQAAPAYLHPTSPQVTIGRTGQLVYVHPVAQDTILGASVFPQGSPYPSPNLCQVNMPKLQGNTTPPLQVCMAPSPLVTGAAQTFAVPSHVPFSQPFPAIRPISVTGGNGLFASKFP